MGITEKDAIKMIGLLPSQGADPIPVRLAAEAEGAGMIEKNQVRMVGVLPSQGADPIPVSGMLYPSPISISSSAMIPEKDTYDWSIMGTYLANRTILTVQNFHYSPVFPSGVTITEVVLFGYRDDILSTMQLLLYRIDRVGGAVLMSSITANWIDGHGSLNDTTIAQAVIDNNNYSYSIIVVLNPNDNVIDVRFQGALIKFAA